MNKDFIFLILNVVILGLNVNLLATFIKLYTEVLKIRHIQNIGK